MPTLYLAGWGWQGPHGWVLDEGHTQEGTLGRALNFGSRTGPGIQKGSKRAGVALPPCWLPLLALLFLWGPIQAKALGTEQNLRINLYLLFLSLQEAGCQSLWGKMFLYTSVLMAGTCPLFYYLIRSKYPGSCPRHGFLVLVVLLLYQRKYLRCFQQIRERRRGQF